MSDVAEAIRHKDARYGIGPTSTQILVCGSEGDLGSSARVGPSYSVDLQRSYSQNEAFLGLRISF